MMAVLIGVWHHTIQVLRHRGCFDRYLRLFYVGLLHYSFFIHLMADEGKHG